MKSIEELDVSDNFITIVPEQIRSMSMLKRVRTARHLADARIRLS